MKVRRFVFGVCAALSVALVSDTQATIIITTITGAASRRPNVNTTPSRRITLVASEASIVPVPIGMAA